MRHRRARFWLDAPMEHLLGGGLHASYAALLFLRLRGLFPEGARPVACRRSDRPPQGTVGLRTAEGWGSAPTRGKTATRPGSRTQDESCAGGGTIPMPGEAAAASRHRTDGTEWSNANMFFPLLQTFARRPSKAVKTGLVNGVPSSCTLPGEPQVRPNCGMSVVVLRSACHAWRPRLSRGSLMPAREGNAAAEDPAQCPASPTRGLRAPSCALAELCAVPS